jgi:ribosomal protein S27AE
MGHYGIQKKTPVSGKRPIKHEHEKVQPLATTTTQMVDPRHSDTCTRCGGFMVSHWCMNVNYDAGGMEILTKRCLQCGEVIDPVILENRLNPQREAMKKKTRPLLSRPLASSTKSKGSGMSCTPVG